MNLEIANRLQKLRKEYILAYKRSLEQQLNNTYILYPDGTKKKVEKKDD